MIIPTEEYALILYCAPKGEGGQFLHGKIIGPLDNLRDYLDEAEQTVADQINNKIETIYRYHMKSMSQEATDREKQQSRTIIGHVVKNFMTQKLIQEVHPSITSAVMSASKHFPNMFDQKYAAYLAESLENLNTSDISGKPSMFMLVPMDKNEAVQSATPDIINPNPDRFNGPDLSNPYDNLKE